MSSFPGMLGMVGLLLRWLTVLVKSHRQLDVENLVLRHQVNILRRRASGLSVLRTTFERSDDAVR